MLLITISSIGFYACKKNSVNSLKDIPQPNKPYLVHSSETVDLLATDSLNSSTTIIRKIQLLDRKTNKVFDTYLIKLQVDDKNDNIFQSLKSKKINGLFEILHDDKTIVRTHVVNGIEGTTEHFGINGNIISNHAKLSVAESGSSPCTFSQVHDCVSKRIKDMGWVEYGLCCATAVECYAGQWLICDFQVCRPSLGLNEL